LLWCSGNAYGLITISIWGSAFRQGRAQGSRCVGLYGWCWRFGCIAGFRGWKGWLQRNVWTRWWHSVLGNPFVRIDRLVDLEITGRASSPLLSPSSRLVGDIEPGWADICLVGFLLCEATTKNSK
jgi:hypothetical protein